MTSPTQTLAQSIDAVKRRVGTNLLSDEDLLVLCAERMGRTFTRDEVGYRAVPADSGTGALHGSGNPESPDL